MYALCKVYIHTCKMYFFPINAFIVLWSLKPQASNSIKILGSESLLEVIISGIPGGNS